MEEDRGELTTKIKGELPEGITILHISLIGSRGKGMSNLSSDYDFRALIHSRKEDYLLNRAKDSLRIETTYQGNVVEGTAFDLRYFLSLIIKSNISARELLIAPHIYTIPHLLHHLSTYIILYIPSTQAYLD